MLGLQTGMPSIKVVPEDESSRIGYSAVVEAFGPGAPGMLQVVAPAEDAAATVATLTADPGIAERDAGPARAPARRVLVQAVPSIDPSDARLGDHHRPAARRTCRPAPWSAAPPRRTTTSRRCWRTRRRW